MATRKYRFATRQAAEDAEQQARRELTISQLALQYALTRDAQAIETTPPSADGSYYHVALYAADSPHGGIVIVTYHHPGQRPSVAAQYADDWCGEWIRYPVAIGDTETAALRELAYAIRREAIAVQNKAWGVKRSA